MKLLEGKTAVITGSSKGLGFAIAKAFAEQGANVVLAARTGSLLRGLVFYDDNYDNNQGNANQK